MNVEHFRWIATIDYLVDAGTVLQVEHHFEEISDLHDFVEKGPNWNAIDKITITLNPHRSTGRLTVEEAENL